MQENMSLEKTASVSFWFLLEHLELTILKNIKVYLWIQCFIWIQIGYIN